MSITKKQTKFIDEYLIDLNATQAAIRAGYSSVSARSTASRLLTYDNIKSEVAKRMTASRVSSDMVIQHLGSMAKGETPTKTVIKKLGVKPGEQETVVISEVVEITETYDVLTAEDRMGKIYALFIDKQIVELDGLEIIDDDEEE